MTLASLPVDPLGRSLFWPESGALVGVSDDPVTPPHRQLAYLRAAEFAGRVYPDNPNRTLVQGTRCWPSLESLPERPHHVFRLTDSDRAVDAIEECGRLGG